MQREDGKLLSLEGGGLAAEPIFAVESDYGEIKIVPTPEGTRGYDDLPRAARREPVDQGLRVPVASPGDLVRMLSARNREVDALKIETMRRVVELDQSLDSASDRSDNARPLALRAVGGFAEKHIRRKWS